MNSKYCKFSTILLISLLRIGSHAQDPEEKLSEEHRTTLNSKEKEKTEGPKTVSSFDEILTTVSGEGAEPPAENNATLTLKFSNDISASGRTFKAEKAAAADKKRRDAPVEEAAPKNPFSGIIATQTSLTLDGDGHGFSISDFRLEDSVSSDSEESSNQGISLISSGALTLTNFSNLTVSTTQLLSKNSYGESSSPSTLKMKNADGPATAKNIPFSILVGNTISITGNGSVVFDGNSNNQIKPKKDAPTSTSDIPAVAQAIPAATDTATGAVTPMTARVDSEQSPASGSLSITNNGSLFVKNNTSATTGGAFAAKTIDISGNGSVYFYGNTSKKSGGALATLPDTSGSAGPTGPAGPAGSSGEVSLLQPKNHPIPFIRADNSRASDPLQTEDSAEEGATTPPNTISLSNNGDVTFYGNMSSVGGAISAQNGCSITGNRNVIFNNNYSNSGGSAIHVTSGSATKKDGSTTNELLIQNNNGVVFSNNTCSTNGGAIFAGSGTSISIYADGGDVVFSGNSTNGTGTCAIFLEKIDATGRETGATGTTATIKSLCAKENCTIAFFDPITTGTLNKKEVLGLRNNEPTEKDTPLPATTAVAIASTTPRTESDNSSEQQGTPLLINKSSTTTTPSAPQPALAAQPAPAAQPTVLNINKKESTSEAGRRDKAASKENGQQTTETYKGTVLFSVGNANNTSNQTIDIPQPITLGGGTLIVDTNTTLKCTSFTQDADSTLRLGCGSKIETTQDASGGGGGGGSSSSNTKIELDLNTFLSIPTSTTEEYQNTITLPAGISSENINIFVNPSTQLFGALNHFNLKEPITFPILKIVETTAANKLSEASDTNIPLTVEINPSTGYSGTLTLAWAPEPEEEGSRERGMLKADADDENSHESSSHLEAQPGPEETPKDPQPTSDESKSEPEQENPVASLDVGDTLSLPPTLSNKSFPVFAADKPALKSVSMETDSKSGPAPQAAGKAKILNATWTPSGYNVSPGFKSPLFFNSSWVGVSAAKAVSHSTLSKIINSSDEMGMSSSGEVLYTSLNFGKKDSDSKYEGKGFEVNLSFGDLSTSSLEVRLARIFGNTSTDLDEKMDTYSYVAGFSLQKTTPSKRIGEVFTEASIYYAFSDNKMYSVLSDINPRKLKFESHSFISAITISGPFLGTPIIRNFFSVTPFIKSEFAFSKLPSCTEEENIGKLVSRSAIVNISDTVHVLTTLPETRLRKYSGSSLYNLSLLSGLSLKATPEKIRIPLSLLFSGAVVGDPYRRYPSGTFTIPQNNIPVFVRGSGMPYISYEMTSMIHVDILKNLSAYADYKGRFASNNAFQAVKVGGSLHF